MQPDGFFGPSEGRKPIIAIEEAVSDVESSIFQRARRSWRKSLPMVLIFSATATMIALAWPGAVKGPLAAEWIVQIGVPDGATATATGAGVPPLPPTGTFDLPDLSLRGAIAFSPAGCDDTAFKTFTFDVDRDGVIFVCRTGGRLLADELAGLERRIAGRLPRGPSSHVRVTWAHSDLVVSVVTPPGFAERTATQRWTSTVDRALRDQGFEAPLVQDSVVTWSGFYTGVGVFVGGYYLFQRALRRQARSRSSINAIAPVSVNARWRADELRCLARTANHTRTLTLAALPFFFVFSTDWASSEDRSLPVPPFIFPALFIAMVAASSRVWRVLDGGRSNRRRLHALSLLAGAIGLIAVLLILTGVSLLTAGLLRYAVLLAATDYDYIATASESEARRTASLVAPALGLGLVALSGPVMRWSRSVLRGARAGVRVDAPTCLFLRSFTDDRVRITLTTSLRNGLFDAWSLRTSDRFEEVITWELCNRYRLTAVRGPSSEVGGLGIDRVKLSDEGWQREVSTEAANAELIVCVLGTTPGFIWEVDMLVANGLLDRTIFLVPPVPDDEIRSRYDAFARCCWKAGRQLEPPPGGVENALAIILAPNDRVVTIGGDQRDEAAYRSALEIAEDSLTS